MGQNAPTSLSMSTTAAAAVEIDATGRSTSVVPPNCVVSPPGLLLVEARGTSSAILGTGNTESRPFSPPTLPASLPCLFSPASLSPAALPLSLSGSRRIRLDGDSRDSVKRNSGEMLRNIIVRDFGRNSNSTRSCPPDPTNYSVGVENVHFLSSDHDGAKSLRKETPQLIKTNFDVGQLMSLPTNENSTSHHLEEPHSSIKVSTEESDLRILHKISTVTKADTPPSPGRDAAQSNRTPCDDPSTVRTATVGSVAVELSLPCLTPKSAVCELEEDWWKDDDDYAPVPTLYQPPPIHVKPGKSCLAANPRFFCADIAEQERQILLKSQTRSLDTAKSAGRDDQPESLDSTSPSALDDSVADEEEEEKSHSGLAKAVALVDKCGSGSTRFKKPWETDDGCTTRRSHGPPCTADFAAGFLFPSDEETGVAIEQESVIIRDSALQEDSRFARDADDGQLPQAQKSDLLLQLPLPVNSERNGQPLEQTHSQQKLSISLDRGEAPPDGLSSFDDDDDSPGLQKRLGEAYRLPGFELCGQNGILVDEDEQQRRQQVSAKAQIAGRVMLPEAATIRRRIPLEVFYPTVAQPVIEEPTLREEVTSNGKKTVRVDGRRIGFEEIDSSCIFKYPAFMWEEETPPAQLEEEQRFRQLAEDFRNSVFRPSVPRSSTISAPAIQKPAAATSESPELAESVASPSNLLSPSIAVIARLADGTTSPAVLAEVSDSEETSADSEQSPNVDLDTVKVDKNENSAVEGTSSGDVVNNSGNQLRRLRSSRGRQPTPHPNRSIDDLSADISGFTSSNATQSPFFPCNATELLSAGNASADIQNELRLGLSTIDVLPPASISNDTSLAAAGQENPDALSGSKSAKGLQFVEGEELESNMQPDNHAVDTKNQQHNQMKTCSEKNANLMIGGLHRQELRKLDEEEDFDAVTAMSRLDKPCYFLLHENPDVTIERSLVDQNWSQQNVERDIPAPGRLSLMRRLDSFDSVDFVTPRSFPLGN